MLNAISRLYLCQKTPKNGLAIDRSIWTKLGRIQNVVLSAFMDMMCEKVHYKNNSTTNRGLR